MARAARSSEELPELRLVVRRGRGSVGRVVSTRSLAGGGRGAAARDCRTTFGRKHGRAAVRREPVPAAYRVFFRHIGLDPDVVTNADRGGGARADDARRLPLRRTCSRTTADRADRHRCSGVGALRGRDRRPAGGSARAVRVSRSDARPPLRGRAVAAGGPVGRGGRFEAALAVLFGEVPPATRPARRRAV